MHLGLREILKTLWPQFCLQFQLIRGYLRPQGLPLALVSQKHLYPLRPLAGPPLRALLLARWLLGFLAVLGFLPHR